MREPLEPYRGADRLNYLCLAIMGPLGHAPVNGFYNLEPLLALASGYESLLATLPSPAQVAIRNLRLASALPATRRGLRIMVTNYLQHHRRLAAQERAGNRPPGAMARRFEVQEDLRFAPWWGEVAPADVIEARTALTAELPLKHWPQPTLHDPSRAAYFHAAGPSDYSARLRSSTRTAPMPELPAYDLQRAQRQPGSVPWADLVAMADRFDATDEQIGYQAAGTRSWYRRLHDEHGTPTAILQARTADGLADTPVLDLRGLQHLIGLPGAGKTTVLYLLAGVMSDRGHQACFLFPSIEVASTFIGVLSRYRIPAALLSGRSNRARARHVTNYAASMARNNGGFGVTSAVAPYFATNCALAGFTESESEGEFPHGNPPCQMILQPGAGSSTARKHQCGLSSVCGLQYSERALAGSTIWAGHVLSLDRTVSPLYIDRKLNHFEYLARTFDLVVVDEADGAQSALDSMGTPELRLFGSAHSLTSKLIQVHDTAATGDNAFLNSAEMSRIMQMSLRFADVAERLTRQLQEHSEDNWLRKNYSRRLMTTVSLVADLFAAPRNLDDLALLAHLRRREAFERLWDKAAKDVAFRNLPTVDAQQARRDDDAVYPDPTADPSAQEEQREWAAIADLAGIDADEARAFHAELVRRLDTWDRDNTAVALGRVVELLRDLPWLRSTLPPAHFNTLCVLLTMVSQVALQHFGLSPHLRLLSSEGLTDESVFLSKPSRDQSAVLPDAIVGRLSGVRFSVSDDSNVEISHIEFGSAPRLLAQRMAALGRQCGGSGPAVLFTSATSMLEDSPSFHVRPEPRYLLRRPNAGDGWAQSRYHFLPQTDPLDVARHLQFSGAPLRDREDILKRMVDRLLQGRHSQIASAIAGNDVIDGVARKAGFAVNSYDQCALLYEHIRISHPDWARRVRYLVQGRIGTVRGEHAVTASDVEALGQDRDWDLLIFPIAAIGRGVNIVFPSGPRQGQAMIGSLYFLTRPHPSADSLGFMQGLVGRASALYDEAVFPDEDSARQRLGEARGEMLSLVKTLMRLPQSASRLGDELARPFVADQMIMILQTIGRAMRGDRPAFVYFIDKAWAPGWATGGGDTPNSSMLVMMQRILEGCLNHSDPATREFYNNLYRPFYGPLRAIWRPEAA